MHDSASFRTECTTLQCQVKKDLWEFTLYYDPEYCALLNSINVVFSWLYYVGFNEQLTLLPILTLAT